ncbi:hypothetical protein KJ713_01490, partial [Patescibacteria group bacterium]|nr:hypothetical protein [Patescibacteria group bacterium]
ILSGSGTPFVIGGTFTPGTSTIKYTGAAATNIAGTTYNNLTVDQAGTTFTAAGDINVGSVLTINTGTFNASNRTITLSGVTGTPFVVAGTFTASTSTVIYSGNYASGNTNVVSITYWNLQFNNAAETYVPAGALDVNGSLTITTGTLSMGANNMTVAGNWLNWGTFTAGSSTVTFDAGATGRTITSGSQAFNNLIFNNAAGGWTFQDGIDINGNLTLTNSDAVGSGVNFNNQAADIDGYLQMDNGKLTLGSSIVNLSGNFTRNAGTLTANTSTLILDGSAGETITSGGQQFNNLTSTNVSAAGVTFADSCAVSGTFTDTTPSSKLTFNAGSTYAFANINLNGGNTSTRINMVSSTPGTQYLFNVSNPAPIANYVDVADSNASAGSQIDATTGGFNSGNNLNWLFGVASITVSPSSATLDQGSSQAFTAIAYDSSNIPVPGTVFTWSVVNGGGSIDNSGIFTAGASAGTFSNTIQATASGVNGYASITVKVLPPTPTSTSQKSSSFQKETGTTAEPIVPEKVIVEEKAVFDASNLKGYSSYHWDFGDGNQADGIKVEHKYIDINRYLVALILKDKSGQEIKKTFSVDALPPIPELTKVGSEKTKAILEGKSFRGTEVIIILRSDPYETRTDSNNDGVFNKSIDFKQTGLAYGDHTITLFAQKKISDELTLKSDAKDYSSYFKLDDNGELKAKVKELEKKKRIMTIIAVSLGVIVVIFIIFFLIKRKHKKENIKIKTKTI